MIRVLHAEEVTNFAELENAFLSLLAGDHICVQAISLSKAFVEEYLGEPVGFGQRAQKQIFGIQLWVDGRPA